MSKHPEFDKLCAVVWPDGTELCKSFGNAEELCKDARELIESLQAENARLWGDRNRYKQALGYIIRCWNRGQDGAYALLDQILVIAEKALSWPEGEIKI